MSSNRYDYGKIALVKGVIETADGNYSEFTIAADGGWQQWGASTERLGHTVGAMEAMSRALLEADLLVSDADEEEEEYDLALLVGVRARHIPEVTNTLAALGLVPELDGTGWQVWSEPADEDDNDGVTHLVRIEVTSGDQAHHVASVLSNGGLLASDKVTDRDQAAIEEVAGTGAVVVGYVTNRDVYCEGYLRVLVRTEGATTITEFDLLGR